ncbi:hypothetical protein [Methylophaga sp. OBS3]|uniref:hypothetical protein n=1 Tax=Methylophaga sp. OBS3 TaxID=2991934 RepID=UPI0022513669|nr:hypothetical protein [Methylophaga sp. OBS3]MCX4189000.1 hypothetical protein [Methylophaga sp. OBS3]
MPHIKLTQDHQPLLQTAIALGDWLLALDGLSEQDQQAIKNVQAALQVLPVLSSDTLAMYGFSIERGDSDAGLVRGWDISLEFFADDPEQQGGLEIFSSYIPIPETTDKQLLAEKKRKEVYFHWAVGDVCNYVPEKQAAQWISEVTDPLKYAQPGDRLRVEIVYGQHYAEMAFPLS